MVHPDWEATMTKVVSIAALLCFVMVSFPAFAQSAKCLAFCAQTCAGKGNACTIHCQNTAKACTGKKAF